MTRPLKRHTDKTNFRKLHVPFFSAGMRIEIAVLGHHGGNINEHLYTNWHYIFSRIYIYRKFDTQKRSQARQVSSRSYMMYSKSEKWHFHPILSWQLHCISTCVIDSFNTRSQAVEIERFNYFYFLLDLSCH